MDCVWGGKLVGDGYSDINILKKEDLVVKCFNIIEKYFLVISFRTDQKDIQFKNER